VKVASKVLAALTCVALGGCNSGSCSSAKADAIRTEARAADGPQDRVFVVPRAKGAISIDGDLDEPDWKRAARTGPFRATAGNEEARPYSEARWLSDGRDLFVALYAADQDIRTQGAVDRFVLDLAPSALAAAWLRLSISAAGAIESSRVSPTGARVGEWESLAVAAVERDGVPDDPTDEDEEWILEVKIPIASLGLAPDSKRFAARVSRCDTPKGSEARCGEWNDGAAPGSLGGMVLTLPR
jgi:hypothetical protein